MSDELDIDQKEYEVSFLTPEETGALDVEKLLASHNVEITFRGPATSIKLSYPIKKHESTFFGFFHFKALPEVAPKLREELYALPQVLRFLIVTPPIKAQVRESRMVGRERGVIAREVREQKNMSTGRQEIKSEMPKVLSNEGLEKELEEILK